MSQSITAYKLIDPPYNLTQAQFDANRVQEMEVIAHALTAISNNLDKYPPGDTYMTGSKGSMAAKAHTLLERLLIVSIAQYYPKVQQTGEKTNG